MIAVLVVTTFGCIAGLALGVHLEERGDDRSGSLLPDEPPPPLARPDSPLVSALVGLAMVALMAIGDAGARDRSGE